MNNLRNRYLFRQGHDLLADVSGRVMNNRTAWRFGERLSRLIRGAVTIHRAAERPRPNPTLVHHDKARAAKFHVLTEDGKPLADFYTMGAQAAAKLAEEIATVLGEPVQVLDNAHTPAMLSRHTRLRSRTGSEIFTARRPNPKRRKRAAGSSRRNPSPFVDVAAGQLRKLFPSGELVQVLTVTGNRARVKNLSRISTDWIDARELKATSKVVQRNPRYRVRDANSSVVWRGIAVDAGEALTHADRSAAGLRNVLEPRTAERTSRGARRYRACACEQAIIPTTPRGAVWQAGNGYEGFHSATKCFIPELTGGPGGPAGYLYRAGGEPKSKRTVPKWTENAQPEDLDDLRDNPAPAGRKAARVTHDYAGETEEILALEHRLPGTLTAWETEHLERQGYGVGGHSPQHAAYWVATMRRQSAGARRNPRSPAVYYIDSRGGVHFVMRTTEAGRAKPVVVGSHATLEQAQAQLAQLKAPRYSPPPAAAPMEYREAVRWLGPARMREVSEGGEREVRRMIAYAHAHHLDDTQAAYEAVLQHDFAGRKANPKRRNPRRQPPRHPLHLEAGDYWQRRSYPQHLARITRVRPDSVTFDIVTGRGQVMHTDTMPAGLFTGTYAPLEPSSPYRKTLPKANPKRRNATARRPRRNPSFRISGVLNATPYPASGQVPPALLEAAGPLPFGGDVIDLDAMPMRRAPLALPPHVPARRARAPRAPRGRTFAAGQMVTVPYQGRRSYFGRPTKKTRDRAIVHGMVTDEHGEPAVYVGVIRGKGYEHTTVPLRQVRKSPRRDFRPVGLKFKDQIAKLMDRWRSRPEALAAEIGRLHDEKEKLYDQVNRLDRVDSRGFPAPAYTRARAAFTRLDQRIEKLENAAYHLANEAGGADPFAVANPGRLNSAELEQAMRTFEMWHEFPAEKLTPVQVHSRQMPRHLVALGKVRRIDYDSSKWEGKVVTYTHATKRPYPTLATDPEARTLYLVGGKMKPTADGLVN